MPLMSPRKMAPRSIVIPPRLSFCLSEASASDSSLSPCTPSPHTPSPYSSQDFPIISKGVGGMHVDEDDLSPSTGEKRSREEEPKVEPEWTDQEVETVQSTLLHPFRPLTISYPPGDLPPPNVIDELTNQVLAYAFRTSPTKRSASNTPMEETYAARTEGWTHSWEATRKKMFDLALAESKGEVVPRRNSLRKEPVAARPGLKRMDSMDFLDEGEDKAPESIGRALRLSTSLQNTAKHEVLSLGMSRSSSDNSITSDTTRMDTTPGPSHTPVPSAIVLTPSSPAPVAASSQTAHVAPPLLKRRGSSRTNTLRRPTSLLQRGKSFTASDLAAEDEPSTVSHTPSASATSESVPVPSPIPEEPRSSPHHSPAKIVYDSPKSFSSLHDPPHALGLLEVDTTDNVSNNLAPSLHPPLVASSPTKPKLNRSVSSSAVLHPHTERDRFMTIKPSSSDRSALAVPLVLDQPRLEKSGGSSWSDSDDELPQKPRAIKKIKGGKIKALRVQAGGLESLSDGELKSPFEEKVQLDL